MSNNPQLASEIAKRRTFAIISHPDAGKTTITEKILLFGGAIQMAGSVKAKKAGKFATSDWMEIEKQRGISVTSSVMQFEYDKHVVTLLDTPGHQDFSEDTYRTLTAVDSALMLIDGAKGVEAQTKKLLEVCRMRHTPVMTFMNKFDRECRSPFDLMDEVEDLLKIKCSPITWPIGVGKEFKGIYHFTLKQVSLFKPDGGRGEFEVYPVTGADDPKLVDLVGEYHAGILAEEAELVEGAGNDFSVEEYSNGALTPVFFGSAMNTFGVQEFLDHFLIISPPPQARATTTRVVQAEEDKFSGFVFKIQANMDPSHRDRLAFVRVCSGKWTKGMKVFHSRLKRQIKPSGVVTFLAQERAQAEESWPGEIIGVHDTGLLKIGDSFTEGEELQFTGIPHFSPELFTRVRLANPLKAKQLDKGLVQLTEEGATQVFKSIAGNQFILGVVGQLQFEVIKYRLEAEYGVEGIFESVGLSCARWYHAEKENLDAFETRNAGQIAWDVEDKKIFLCNSTWDLDYAAEKFKGIEFYQNSDHAPV